MVDGTYSKIQYTHSLAIKNRMTMASPFLLLRYFAVCLLNMVVVNSTSSFLTNTPGQAWRMVGSLNMTDPTQHCPDSWQNFISPRSCGKKTTAPCDSLSIPTFGVNYQKVCGWFRGYQFGSTDAFGFRFSLGSVEGDYVDGVSITYASPGRRQHVYTYASGSSEQLRDDTSVCPCQGGACAPSFVGSDYYCESGTLIQGGGLSGTPRMFYGTDCSVEEMRARAATELTFRGSVRRSQLPFLRTWKFEFARMMVWTMRMWRSSHLNCTYKVR